MGGLLYRVSKPHHTKCSILLPFGQKITTAQIKLKKTENGLSNIGLPTRGLGKKIQQLHHPLSRRAAR